MSTAVVIVIVVLVLLVAAGVAYYLMQRRTTQTLQQRFGHEYDRTVEEAGDRRAAERELSAREKRHETLDIQPLRPERAQDYRASWEEVQRRFVDQPDAAVQDADALVEAVMSERGYPVGDFDTKVADLSVEHADVLQHYRAAHAIASSIDADEQTVDTEQLRRAMVHYRALFGALLEDTSATTDERTTTRRNA
jgi:hypothetical protein